MKPARFGPAKPHNAHWGVADPAAVDGDHDDIATAFKITFEQMNRRIEALVAAQPERANLTEIARQIGTDMVLEEATDNGTKRTCNVLQLNGLEPCCLSRLWLGQALWPRHWLAEMWRWPCFGNTIATGAILVVLITILGPLSGAHFNPAVTTAFLLRGAILAGAALGYIASQIAEVAGTILAHAMFAQDLVQFSANRRSGIAQYGSEFVATSGLLLVIFGGSGIALKRCRGLLGSILPRPIGLPPRPALPNPAVTIARTFTDTFSGIDAGDTPFFILAQMLAVPPTVWFASWLFAGASDKAD